MVLVISCFFLKKKTRYGQMKYMYQIENFVMEDRNGDFKKTN